MHVDDPAPPEIVVGAQLTASPEDGEVEVDRFTAPEKPFRAPTVTVNVALEPVVNVRLVGFAPIVKSAGSVWKNSVIGVALASFDVRLCKFQLTSIVLVSE